MTVATRPSPRAGEVAGLEAQARLAQASFTVDEQPERFIELVRAAPVEQLRNVAPRLLELLSAKTFGLQRFGEATPREVAVRAVLRAGYPWALELEPEDVAFVREQETSARRARRRSVLRRLVPLGLALLGFGFVVNGFVRVVSARRPENAVTVQPRSVTLHPPRSRPVAPDVSAATLDELVPAADLAPLLVATIDGLIASGREAEALGVGLDCLALRQADEGRCALATHRALAALGRRESREVTSRGPGRSARARAESLDRLFLFSEAPHAAAVRRETRPVMAALKALAVGDVVAPGTPANMAREAKARFARGEFTAALNVAEHCVALFPAEPDCLSVAATALPLVQAARPVADRIAREAEVAAQFEGYRRQLARVLAHAAREGCEAEPPSADESRPIACP